MLKTKMAWGEQEDMEAPSNSPVTDNGKEPAFIESIDNHIYFYSEIDRDKILTLNHKLRSLGGTLSHQAMLENRKPSNLYLHINSYGGSIFQGLSGMDNILNCPVNVYTIVDGAVASAASFLSIVGKKRLITENSYMLIHQLSSMSWGKFREMKDDMKNCEEWMKRIKSIYAKYTKVPESMIDEILDHDIWFDADQCMKYKLVDEIWR